MEKTRPILYGVSDYAEMRRRNGWFIDRTAKIRDFEATHYAVFLRPRRFGKSLFTSILEAYYDVRYADRFDEFFAGTDIGANPTDERGKYLVLRFDFAVRNAVEGEKVVQSTLVALLCAAGGPYFVRHEREFGSGFYDIALAPQLDRWPEIAHAALIEMKYVKAGDPKPTPEQLADIKAKAIEQLDRYSADPALSAPWRLKSGNGNWGTENGTVELHRLVMVFHGGECVLTEEV